MRKFILLFLAFMLLAVPCAAEDVSGEGAGASCGTGLSWYVEGSALHITGDGEMDDFYNGPPWVSYKNTLTQVILGDGVTSVGAYAFQDYDNLTYVQFGSTLTRIGEEAFSSCDGLTSITLPATFKKFGQNCLRSCKSLQEIHCSGYFPRFDDGCLWDTYCTIYYSTSNPWSTVYIEQLEAAFHGRIEFRASDGTDPYVPTEATQPTQPTYVTEPVTSPIIFTVPTEPVQTVPQTAPTVSPAVMQTEPETTRETLPVEHATRPTYDTEPRRGTDGSSIYGVLILVIMLSIIATASLLFRASRKPRRRSKYRR